MNDSDVCRCGHSRADHTPSCQTLRPVGIGSTPPGFRQQMERCRCLGFGFWRTAEACSGYTQNQGFGELPCRDCGWLYDDHTALADAGHVTTAVFLLFVIFGCLAFLLMLKGAQPVVCWMNDDAMSYCDGYTAVQR